jgi:uncharacterized membrane protein
LPDPFRLRPQHGLLALGALALALGWPLVAARIHDVRLLAGAMLALSLVSLTFVRRALPSELTLGPEPALALLGLVVGAAVTGARWPLLLVPAWVQLAAAWLCLRSLRAGTPLIERAAFAIQPHAPEFIRPYCRRSTAFWGWLFVANAVAIVALALLAPFEVWRAFSAVWVWVLLALASAADFAVRKLYFRLYDENPLDRLLARVFPAENTEMGRRSNRYRVEKRLSLGLDPRTGRAQVRENS